MNRAASTLLCLWLGGCALGPGLYQGVHQYVRITTFDERDLRQLDPNVFKARVRMAHGFALDPNRTTLHVTVASEAGKRFGEFKLETVAEKQAEIQTGPHSGFVMGTEYVLRLAAPSQSDFTIFQGFAGTGRPGRVTFGVTPALASYPAGASKVKIWIELLLSKDLGYVTFIDAEVPIGATR